MKLRNKAKLLLTVVFISQYADAGMRCTNGKLANKNDKTTEVIVKCGQPEKMKKYGRVNVGEKSVYLERWTYVPEPGKFIKYLEFHNGILVKITNGSRVR